MHRHTQIEFTQIELYIEIDTQMHALVVGTNINYKFALILSMFKSKSSKVGRWFGSNIQQSAIIAAIAGGVFSGKSIRYPFSMYLTTSWIGTL